MTELSASRFEEYTVQQYARAVRPHLPAEIFRPEPARLIWLPVHLAVIAALATFVVGWQPAWYVALACALIAGHSWACLGFLAHEVLHHAVVRNRTVERLVGYCGLLIFCLSPTLWNAWHNQEHHGNTGKPGRRSGSLRHAGDLAGERRRPRRGGHRPGFAPQAQRAVSLFHLLGALGDRAALAQRARQLLRAHLTPHRVPGDRRDVRILAGPVPGWSARGTSSSSALVPALIANGVVDVVHRDQPLPEPAHRDQRSAGELAVGARAAVGRVAAPAVRLSRRAPHLPDRQRPPRARHPRRAASASTATATCRCRTRGRCACSTRGRRSTTTTTR